MRTTSRVMGLVLMSCSCWAQHDTPNAQISGIVTGNDGQALGGAIVMASLQPESAVASYAPYATSTVTAKDGSYELRNLPFGNYKLCAEHRAALMLNPCTWSRDQIMAKVTASEPSAEAAIKMTKGGLVTIRVDDRSGLFTAHRNSVLAHILIGTSFGTGGVISASTAADAATAREVALILPYDTPTDVVVHSGFFKLADADGVEYKDHAIKIPVSLKAGANGSSIVLQLVSAGK